MAHISALHTKEGNVILPKRLLWIITTLMCL